MNQKKLINIESINKKTIDVIFSIVKSIEENPEKFKKDLESKTLAILFFQPSTRTRIGFSVAMQKLGGNVVNLSETKYSEIMSKGEDFEDTIRVMTDYSDVICLRHFSKEAIYIAEKIVNKPLINCGNGTDQHPTQTLIDLYTIWKEFKRLDNLKIALVGDLKNMRSAHSLIMGLSFYNNNKIKLISPKTLKMPKEYLDKISNQKIKILESKEFKIDDEDVIYMTGMPAKLAVGVNRKKYQMNEKNLGMLKKSSIILNPLPRIDEITKKVDKFPQAKYFQQSANGLFVRMGILKWIFN